MTDHNKQKRIKRAVRHHRVRARIFGSLERPRLSIYKANVHIYAQVIDDNTGKTLVSASSKKISKKAKKSVIAAEVGKLLAKEALAKNIKAVVLDRGGFAYHGRIKALADGAREGGLIF